MYLVHSLLADIFNFCHYDKLLSTNFMLNSCPIELSIFKNQSHYHLSNITVLCWAIFIAMLEHLMAYRAQDRHMWVGIQSGNVEKLDRWASSVMAGVWRTRKQKA